MKCQSEYSEYYNNCANQIRLCSCCVLGSGRSKLHYSPIDKELNPHPYEEILKKNKARGKASNRQGKDAEEKSRQALARKLVQETVASGQVKGDGDGLLLEEFRYEHKKRESISITPAEYEKGLRQQIDVWQLTNKAGRRMYILTEETFVKLLAAYNYDHSN